MSTKPISKARLDELIHSMTAKIGGAMFNGMPFMADEPREIREALCDYARLREENVELKRDAAWGAHNGGAHQLIKLHHADAMKLYAALKLVRPNHSLVDELRTSYCEIHRSSSCGQAAAQGPRHE